MAWVDFTFHNAQVNAPKVPAQVDTDHLSSFCTQRPPGSDSLLPRSRARSQDELMNYQQISGTLSMRPQTQREPPKPARQSGGLQG